VQTRPEIAMRRFLLSLAALAALSSPAFATGGFSCSVKDKNLTLDAEAGFSYSIGGGLLNFRGTFELPKKLAPKGLERVTLTPSHLAHDWLYDGELRLLLHAETEGDLPFGSVDIIVKTKMTDDETTYDGDYKLILNRADADSVEHTGKVSCSVG
jgi:hypothetical protein